MPELEHARQLIEELNQENEALAQLVVELMILIASLMDPGQLERVH